MFELIHTSAPRGLFGGSGYTTVAATQGMPDALRKVLESLSGYEQVFEYGSPQFQSNPEGYICQPVGQAAGKSWWVLSRIVVAEKDYTGRSNYLAHHVAMDHTELPQAGPAALARTFPWMASWTGEPRMLAARSLPAIAAPAPPLSAPTWTRAGLDAGWAGHLAEQARSRRGVVQLVYPHSVDPLALITDAVALLPPAERWDARFHTHTSRPRPDQAWAWFPAEAAASTDLARRPGVVYLAMRPPCPSSGPLVEQARGKTAPTPAMGGAGMSGFPGNTGGAALPVATAFATSTDPFAPAGRGTAGSWGAPPVPTKASLVGPILHWTAHGVMVVAVLVLGFLLLMKNNGKAGGDQPKPDVETKTHNPVPEPKKEIQGNGGADKFPKLPDVPKAQQTMPPAPADPVKKPAQQQDPAVPTGPQKDSPPIKKPDPMDSVKPAAPLDLPELPNGLLGQEIPNGDQFKVKREKLIEFKKSLDDLKGKLEQSKPTYIHLSKKLANTESNQGNNITIKFLVDDKQNKLITEVGKLGIDAGIKEKCIRAILTLGIEADETKLPRMSSSSINDILKVYFESPDDPKKTNNSLMEGLVYWVISEKIRLNKIHFEEVINGLIENYRAISIKQSDEDKKKGAARLQKAEKFKADYKEFITALEGWSPK